MASEQFSIPVTILRGGTSKGVFILEEDLPEDRTLWGPYLIELMGSRSGRQIDGLGGADSTTSKVCIIGPNPDPDLDITYTFAQVGIGEEVIYWDVNCGNLSAAVGTFAILSGLVEPTLPITTVRVHQANTNTVMRIEVPVDEDGPLVDGPLAIGGVPGTGAGVGVDFAKTVGATLGGELFPTGNRMERLDVPGIGVIDVTIADLANMSLFFRARDIGIRGTEGTAQAGELAPIFAKIRLAAQEQLLGMTPGGALPWPISIAEPQPYTSSSSSAVIAAESHDFVARFTGIPPMGQTMHPAFPTTGASVTSVVAVTPGTIVNEFYAPTLATSGRPRGLVSIGHPSGVMEYEAAVSERPEGLEVERALAYRTVRLLMEGKTYLRRSEIARMDREMPRESPTRSTVPLKEPALT